MASRFATPEAPAGFLEHRRAAVELVQAASFHYFKVHGLVQVIGTGETNADLEFPVMFTDPPMLHFGGELQWGNIPDSGFYPTWSACMAQWDTQSRADGSLLYVGGFLGIVTTGAPGQVMNIHWTVEGQGIRSPSVVSPDS